MKHLLASMAVAVLLAATAFAQVPVIDGPEKIDAYKFVDLSVSGDWESAIWEFTPDISEVRMSDNGRKATLVAPPGKYVARAVVVNFTAKKIAQPKKTFTIGEVTPPDPPIPPVPTPGEVSELHYIWETGEASQATAAVTGNKAWRDKCHANGVAYLVVDDETAEPWYPAEVKAAREVGLPAVALIGKDKSKFTVRKAPATAAAMMELVSGLRGAK